MTALAVWGFLTLTLSMLPGLLIAGTILSLIQRERLRWTRALADDPTMTWGQYLRDMG